MTTHLDVFIPSLYEAQCEKMLKFAYRMVGSIETAQDLVHETFLLALFSQDKLADHPNPEGWLMKTLRNLTLNERRRIENHSTVPLEMVDNYIGKELYTSLDLLLPKQLSKEEREILVWRFEQQMEYREIADRLGISEVGCRSRVSRAVVHCRKYMNDF